MASLSVRHNVSLPGSLAERVEIRRCAHSETFATIQLAAWEPRKEKPSIVVDTNQVFIEKLLMSGGVFAIETGGGTAEKIFVIAYTRGIPRLVLELSTKGSVRFNLKTESLEVLIASREEEPKYYRFSSVTNPVR